MLPLGHYCRPPGKTLALDQIAVIADPTGTNFSDVRHKFFYFRYENSCFLRNHWSHKIVADKTYCAYYFSLQVGNRLRAQVSATTIPPLHKTAFDFEATQRWALNAIVTQSSAELPTRRSNDRYAAKRRVTVEDARAPQRSRSNDTRGR
jgi:hypothetical protein